MTTERKTRKAPAAGSSVNPKLATLAAEHDEIEAILRSGGLGDDGEDEAAVDRLVKLEDRLAKVPATSMEDMKLKARYVDLNCVKAHNIGPVPASIIRDLLALGGKRGERQPRDRSSVTRPRKRPSTPIPDVSTMKPWRTNFSPPKAMLSMSWPKRLASLTRNSSKSCAIYSLMKLE